LLARVLELVSRTDQDEVPALAAERGGERQSDQATEELRRHGELAGQALALGASPHVPVDRSSLLGRKAGDPGGHELGQPRAMIPALCHEQVPDSVAEGLFGAADEDGGVPGWHPKDLGHLPGCKISANAEVEHRVLPRLQAGSRGPDEVGDLPGLSLGFRSSSWAGEIELVLNRLGSAGAAEVVVGQVVGDREEPALDPRRLAQGVSAFPSPDERQLGDVLGRGPVTQRAPQEVVDPRHVTVV
jgi:hypothetical protein